MSFIEIDGIDDVTEAKPVPNGEYTIVISDVKEKNDDAGVMKGLLVTHEIEGAPDNTSPVFHNISLPMPTDDADKKKNKLLFMKRYFVLAGIDFAGGIDVTKMIGKRFRANLKLDTYEGVTSNKIVVPSIK